MKFRYVVRPKGILGTPKAVARELGFRVRFYPNPAKHRIFDYQRDFFMGPVAPQHVKNAPLGYGTFHDFTTRNKYGQRQALAEAGFLYLSVPQVSPKLRDFLSTTDYGLLSDPYGIQGEQDTDLPTIGLTLLPAKSISLSSTPRSENTGSSSSLANL